MTSSPHGRVLRIAILSCALAALAFAASAWAAAGTLDPGFSNDGQLAFLFLPRQDDYFGSRIAVDAHDRAVIVGASFVSKGRHEVFAITRLLPDGEFDPAFSGDGRQTVSGLEKDANRIGIAVQGQSKVIVAGPAIHHKKRQFIVARLNARGELDRTFSHDGVRRLAVGPEGLGSIVRVRVDAQKRILVCGDAHGAAVVARLTPDGSPDPSFAANGKKSIRFTGRAGRSYCGDVASEPDGSLVVAGGGSTQRYGYLGVARLDSHGQLERDFGTNGHALTRFSGDAGASGVALQPDGGIVAVGSANRYGSNRDRFAAARFLPSGELDTSFSGNGLKTFAFPHKTLAFADDVALQPDGRIVLAGTAEKGQIGPFSFATARLDPDGQLDPSFSDDGRVSQNFGHHGSIGAGASGVALQSSGRILVAGDSDRGRAGFGVAVAAYRSH